MQGSQNGRVVTIANTLSTCKSLQDIKGSCKSTDKQGDDNKQKQQQKHTTKPQHNGNKELPTTYAHRVSLPKVAKQL